MEEKACQHLKKYPRLNPEGIEGNLSTADLIDQTFLAYNAGRLREGCQLFTRKMLSNNGLIGMSLTGALTPAGLGRSCIIPLIEGGYVDGSFFFESCIQTQYLGRYRTEREVWL